ncbi:hypothetical protein AAV94_13140 [Lampropedia cohaerens]|uniref:Uncharacterized protein n=1 Tax=Lampropedia cohaerens TaxID=1610491 RepID=A0A0U1PWT4_9BURK|nr:hypothetical protein [Lampropedia cohaerens]KKW66998.1 hypothetical protein AAV94_13140 [Lampropedia cohaerens]
MHWFELLMHGIALLMPAWALSLLFTGAARWLWRKPGWRVDWWTNALLLGVAGSVWSLLALVWTGADGSVVQYALMVVGYAALQALLMRQST